MFQLADNRQIGEYLRRAIKERGFESDRKFCKAYLELRNESTEQDTLQNMANRVSQILKGKKAVQLEDLPVFTMLLDMSCEEILSAGQCFSVSSNRLTNYSVALSDNRAEWEAYVKQEDQLILNADEYGKTVIDYALKFKNYGFMKFLMDNGYIWFVGADEEDYLFDTHFGAGTSIKQDPSRKNNMSVLDNRLKERYDLRMKMILLAVEHKDMETLDALRAREIPSFYQYFGHAQRLEECPKYFDADLMAALSGASNEILDYFSKEFEITDRVGNTCQFIFPFIGSVIDTLIESGNDYAEWILKDAIKHNQYTLDRLSKLVADTVGCCKEKYRENWSEEFILRVVQDGLRFYSDGNLVIVNYFSFMRTPERTGFTTNIVKTTAVSDNPKISRLIEELNELYQKIKEIPSII